MRNLLVSGLFVLAACGGSSDNGITNPPPPKKPDPYLAIRVRDMLDTTTAPGRAHWHVFAFLTGPYDRLNGIAQQGNIGLNDMRLNHTIRCVLVQSDSVGQRFISVVAFADTTTEQLTADQPFNDFAQQWYAGSRNVPAGWMALSFAATDAWQSQQYLDGHGLTNLDPIRWNFDWTGRGTTAFVERSDAEPECSRV